MRKALLLAALVLGCMPPAFAASFPVPAPVVNGPPPPAFPASNHALTRLRSRLGDLRQIGLALRAGDGGTLTAEHLAFLQTRIDAAYADYRRARY